MQNTQLPDHKKLNRIGGWLYLMLFRLAAAAVMSGISAIYAPSLGYGRFIPLFAGIALSAVGTAVLLFCKKRAFRIGYCLFACLSLVDYALAQDAMGFVVCMAVETCWVLYLFFSVRVKLILGLLRLPELPAPANPDAPQP